MRTIIIDSNRQSIWKLVTKLKQYSEIDIVVTYTSISDDIRTLLNEKIDIVFIDYSLSDNARMDFIVQSVQQYPAIQIILMKTDASHLLDSAISEIHFLSKPIDQASLDQLIENKRNKMMERASLQNQTNPIIATRYLVEQKNKEKMESIFLKIIKD